MRETTRRERTIKTEVTTALRCDRCDKSMLAHNEFVVGSTFKGQFGYGSRFDTTSWSFDLCDACCGWLRGQLRQIQEDRW